MNGLILKIFIFLTYILWRYSSSLSNFLDDLTTSIIHICCWVFSHESPYSGPSARPIAHNLNDGPMPMVLAMQAQDPLSTVQTNYGLYAFTRTPPPSRSGRDFRRTPRTKPKPATALNMDRLGANRISPCFTWYPPGKGPDYHQRGKLTSTPSGRTTATDPQQVCPCLQTDLPANSLLHSPFQETLRGPTWRAGGKILGE